MHKLLYFFKDGSQKEEQAIWENANAAKVHAEEQMKWKKNIHMIRLNPIDGSKPINVIREEK
jgi:hypothetical protein